MNPAVTLSAGLFWLSSNSGDHGKPEFFTGVSC